MPFKKGVTPLGAKPFVKGQSGNPKGRRRKLVLDMQMNGYTCGQVTDTINVMLAMDIDELKAVFDTGNVLEKTVANSLMTALKKGSLFNLDLLLSRAQGKPVENVNMNQTFVEQPFWKDE